MTVEFGNIYYFVYIVIAVLIISALYLLLRNKSRGVQSFVLFSLLFFNLALHFIKLAFPPYVDGLPTSIHKVTFENICAASTILFPFLFLSKSKLVHDYMYFIGVISGLAALIYPTEALGESPIVFETIRFYICHTILIAVPLVSAMIGLHRPRSRSFWCIPLFFILHETVIMLNEIVLLNTGLINGTLESFLSRASRNNSFVHGPTPDLDGVGKYLTMFTPDIFTKDIFGINGGQDFYWPVIWLIVPIIVYFIPIYLAISLPFVRKKK